MHTMVLFWFLSENQVTTADTSAVKVALISAIATVIATAFGVLGNYWRKRGDSDADLVRQAATLELKNQTLEERVDELEDTLWRNGIDPHTGQPIHRQTGP